MRIVLQRPPGVLALAWVLLGALGLGACSRGSEAPARTGAAADAWFEEVGAASGLEFRHVFGRERRFWLPEIIGPGLGFADIDEDGNLDLYVVQSGDLLDPSFAPEGNRLYRNRADGSFDDVTARAGVGDRGYGMGCTFGDYDADGHVDLYVTNYGPNVLYHNEGQGRFADVTAAAGVGDPRWGTSCAFVDYDTDGDLDLYVVNYVNWAPERELSCSSTYATQDYCSPKNYNAPAVSLLYRNEGQRFTDVTEAAGLTKNFGNGLGTGIGDFDDDGYVDLYVANDGNPNQLWINQGDGTFRDEALLSGCAVDSEGKAEAGMGCAVFDYQEDGDLDLFLTHLPGETNTLFANDGGLFTDTLDRSGLATPSLLSSGFGVGSADFDHDGWRDFFVANGRVTSSSDPSNPFAERNQLLRGVSAERFEEVELVSGAPIGISRGAAFGDYDNDGDVDIAYADNGSSVKLLRNVRAPKGHWVMLRVLDARGSDALFARVRVQSGALVRWSQVQAAYSYCSSNDPRVHFGLGSEGGPLTATVRWIDGARETFGPLLPDRQHVLRRGTGQPAR